MSMTILGAGNMARGIGTRLVAGGNSLTLMSRDPQEGATLAAERQAGADNGALVQAAPFGSPLRDDVVILVVPYTAEAENIQQHHAQLPGKMLVNITNPLNATQDGLATPPGSSDAEEIARMVPPAARVVKAFNTTFARTLVEAGGLRGIDTGQLSRARQLEEMGFLDITLQGPLGTHFMSVWKLLFP
jgi:predicted dinucleotide-binding enzyme